MRRKESNQTKQTKHWHITRYARADPRFLERGFLCIKAWGFRFADFISFFSNIPWKWNNLVSLRPNYFIIMGYLKMGSRISGKGFFMYKSVGGSLCWFYLIFLNTPWKENNLVSLRLNYFIVMGYLKTGSRISRKGVLMYKSVGGSLAWFYLVFHIYPMKMK